MFTLIELPYTMEALEPVISAQTLSFHHGKHLQAYVDNLNKLLPGSEFEGMALEEIVRKAPAGPVFNNAGQILRVLMPLWLSLRLRAQDCLALAGYGSRQMVTALW